jgi:hypothetical protein
MDHNNDSVLENFNRVHRGEVTNVSFSHANVVMLSRDHYHLLCEALENMLAAFDSPIARRRMPSDFAAEARQVARAALQQENEHE